MLRLVFSVWIGKGPMKATTAAKEAQSPNELKTLHAWLTYRATSQMMANPVAMHFHKINGSPADLTLTAIIPYSPSHREGKSDKRVD